MYMLHVHLHLHPHLHPRAQLLYLRQRSRLAEGEADDFALLRRAERAELQPATRLVHVAAEAVGARGEQHGVTLRYEHLAHVGLDPALAWLGVRGRGKKWG